MMEIVKSRLFLRAQRGNRPRTKSCGCRSEAIAVLRSQEQTGLQKKRLPSITKAAAEITQ